MAKTAHRFPISASEISLPDLARYAEDWLLEGQLRQLSPNTLDARRFLVQKFLWFLNERGRTACGPSECRAFLAYVGGAHETQEGRWGKPGLRKPVRPRTVQTYYVNLKTLFAFLLKEEVIEVSPLEKVSPPIARADQIQPFTTDQLSALLIAARKSRHSKRDVALLHFMLDTGCRATEVCGLRLTDIDLNGRRCTVLGKGNKTRTVYFGRETTKALWAYLKAEPRDPDHPLFIAEGGTRAGEPLTRSGLFQLIERHGRAAAVEAVRCSPHTFRHTFAIQFLRNGGNVFALQVLLGHTSLKMTNRYVALAEADLEAQHRQCSPVDRLKSGK